MMSSDEEDEPEQGQEFSLLCLLAFLSFSVGTGYTSFAKPSHDLVRITGTFPHPSLDLKRSQMTREEGSMGWLIPAI